MSETRTPHATGGCQCGAVRYALYVAPQNSHVCHCRMCQRATGGLFAALAGAPKAGFAWIKGEPGVFASSTLATRAFCRDCGTPLSFSYNQPEARFYVTIGSLDDPNAAPIGIQYGTEAKIGWVTFCEGLPSEETGSDPKAQALFAGMTSNQG
ncbi:MAG: GFA family protein [Proteobacteria bacterium]|nr:GFA family protein [Pseudomonadota bacterium]